jgi:GNAT superfamily N-acetyltransferase
MGNAEPAGPDLVEDVYAEWFAHLDGVPGIEVHCDPDISWKLTPGASWSNCGVRLRLDGRNPGARLDHILDRYQKHGRGAGFWVGPSAQPENLPALLKKRALHCRKYFPAMYCDLSRELPGARARVPLEIEITADYGEFRRRPHPSIGRITTPIRQFQLATQEHLASRTPRLTWDFIARSGGEPVGACTLFLGRRHAGIFDVGVPERLRNRGIGRALVGHACSVAKEGGLEGVILIATNLGHGVYHHVGFQEVGRIGFWYTAYP